MRGMIGLDEIFKSRQSGHNGIVIPQSKMSRSSFSPVDYYFAGLDPHKDSVVLFVVPTGNVGTNTITDISQRGRTLTVYGNTSVSSAQSAYQQEEDPYGGKSIYVDGDGDYIYVPYNSDLTLDGQFTIECWLWKTNSGPYDTIFELGNYNNGILFRCGYAAGGQLYVNGSAPITDFTDEIGFNRWTHTALTRDTSNTLRLFINGTLYQSATGQSGTYNNGNGYLNIAMSTHITGQHHQGYIDRFRITKGVCRYVTNFDPKLDTFLYGV